MSRLPHLSLTRVLLVFALLAAGYLGVTTGRYVITNYQARGEEAALRAELRQLDEDRGQLTAVREYLRSDEYIEYVARRILGLVRPGETLVIVNGAELAPTATPEAAGVPAPPAPWWKDLFVVPVPTATATR